MNVTCSFGKENEKFGNCGSWHPSSTRLPNEDVVPLRSLTRDVTHLLRNIRASGSKVADSHRVKAIAEWELILNLSQNMRLSEKEIGGMTICPRHRKNLTRLRDRKAKCCSPFHVGQNPVLKLPKRVTKDLSETIYDHLRFPVPIGTGTYANSISETAYNATPT